MPPESFSKITSGRALNRPRESRGSHTSGVLLVLFVQAKRIKPFPFRESSEVLQTSNQHTQNNNFARTKLKPFPKGDSRFSKPRISPPKQQLRINPIKSFPILFVRHKKYDKKAFAPFGAARSACIPPPSAASQKRKDPFCL